MSTTFAPGSACAYTDSSKLACQQPGISLNSDGEFVEVHQDTSGRLYYMLGKIALRTYKFTSGAIDFAGGRYPEVALKDGSDNNFVMLAYTDTYGHLHTLCGEADFTNNTIDFSAYNSGVPATISDKRTTISNVSELSVAINKNGAVVLFYSDTSHNMYYKTGFVDEQSHVVSWSDAVVYKDSSNAQQGRHPHIAMSSDGHFVTVHQSQSYDSLYYNLGTVSINNGVVTLTFKLNQDTEYLGDSLGSSSVTPAVAMNKTGMVFEVHGASGGYDLYFQNGKLDLSNSEIDKFTSADSVRYFNSYLYESDMKALNPAVALNDGGWAIHVYETSSSQLYMAVASVSDRESWMASYGDKTIGSMIIPGSHDAGMSVLTQNDPGSTADNTLTQIKDIANQLKAGIRYFDIRPIFDSTSAENTDQIWSGHYSTSAVIMGGEGQQMSQILGQVNDFIRQSSSKSEVVIIKFSHYLDTALEDEYFTDPGESTSTKQTLIDNLMKLIKDKTHSSNRYVHTSTTRRITEMLLSEITGGSGKIIFLFDLAGLSGVDLKQDFACTYMDMITPNTHDINPSVSKNSAQWVMYDNYSQTTDVTVMTSRTDTSGQVYRMLQSGNHAGDMYLCSWTLTLTTGMAMDALAISILEMCQKANGVLAQDMVQLFGDTAMAGDLMPNILYVDSADCFVTDTCISLNNTADAFLQSLVANTGVMTPEFVPTINNYTLPVANNTTQIVLTATTSDDKATIKINGHNQTQGTAIGINLNQGNNTITIEVTAQNRVTKKSYVLTVTRN